MSAVRYFVTKGKALGTSLIKVMAIVNRYTTDTLPILSWQFTDKLPTHYWYYLDWLSVDLLADTQPTVKLGQLSTDSRRCQLSTDTSLIPYWYLINIPPIHCWHTTDATSTDCWSICQLILDRQENATWPIDIDRLLINTWSILDQHSRQKNCTHNSHGHF